MSRPERDIIYSIPGAKESISRYFKKYDPPAEILCFEDDYQNIINDMKNNPKLKSVGTVVDIGCAFGFQSIMFHEAGYNYIGVNPGLIRGLGEGSPLIPFYSSGLQRHSHLLCHYYEAMIPLNTSLIDCVCSDAKSRSEHVFVSNMSIGFEGMNLFTPDQAAEALSIFSYGYIKTTQDIVDSMDKRFRSKRIVLAGEEYDSGFGAIKIKGKLSDLIFYDGGSHARKCLR